MIEVGRKQTSCSTGLRFNRGRRSRSSLTTALPLVSLNIIYLHRKRKVVFVFFFLPGSRGLPFKISLFCVCLTERMPCLMHYFYSPVWKPPLPSRPFVVSSLASTCSNFTQRQLKHASSAPSSTFKGGGVGKVIVICEEKMVIHSSLHLPPGILRSIVATSAS